MDDNIDWTHIRCVISLHWGRILIEFEPTLHHNSAEILSIFRDPNGLVAKHRMREGRKTVCHPLGTNSENSGRP
ncbi:hypothetical protein R3P38DRAFT_2894083 [Favolaschia claudopus]|uniref:DUF6589 domain-containing protein n=1 Tax=Favolaschia claudopus TaxID=2862362 RepID=A0AAW0CSB6_9AGAR